MTYSTARPRGSASGCGIAESRPGPWRGLVWLGSLASADGRKDADLNGELVGADHLAFYTAARLIRDGRPEQLYNYDVPRREYQSELLGRGTGGRRSGYRNPPFYALLYLPTAGLPFYAELPCLDRGSRLRAACRARDRQPACRPDRTRGRALPVGAHVLPGVRAPISFGQNTLLSLGDLRRRVPPARGDRPFAAGLVAGLLWFKPQLLLGLFVWWAARIRRHMAVLARGARHRGGPRGGQLARAAGGVAGVRRDAPRERRVRRRAVEQAHPAGVLARCSCRACRRRR